MAENSLQRFIEGVTSTWGPLSSELVAGIRRQMEELVKSPASEPWLAQLLRDAPPDQDLYRHPKHGFILLAHTESQGRYRPPHDHGRGWVIYAVQSGEIDMGTWTRLPDLDGKVRLVKREPNLLRPGQVKVFLPGDIHDTRTLAGPALILRFTERDLIPEEHDRHLTRYVHQGGAWAVKAA